MRCLVSVSAVGVKRSYTDEDRDAIAHPSKKRKTWQYDAPLPQWKLKVRTIYQRISEQEIYGRLQSLFHTCLKPLMQTNGDLIIKVSRRDYSFLDASYFVTVNGMFFKQLHKSFLDRVDGPRAPASKTSPFLDHGMIKTIYILDSIPGFPQMVRGVYQHDLSVPNLGDEKMREISHRYYDHPNFLVGYYLAYTSSKSEKIKRNYIMRRMDVPFSKFKDIVTVSSAVSLTLQFARGIQVLIKNGWYIPDLHYGNIVIRRDAEIPDGYHLAIIDFDLMEEDNSSEAQSSLINDIWLLYEHLKIKEPKNCNEENVAAEVKVLAGKDHLDIDTIVLDLERHATLLDVCIPRGKP